MKKEKMPTEIIIWKSGDGKTYFYQINFDNATAKVGKDTKEKIKELAKQLGVKIKEVGNGN